MVRQVNDIKKCIKCGVDLVCGINWLESQKHNSRYTCRDCNNARKRIDYLKTGARDRLKRGHLPMSENKKCASYLGCHIAENVLHSVFKDVEMMPVNNPGFDFICAHGMKIDVKSACINKSSKGYSRWGFHINRNVIADYFLCLAFDNRNDLNPIHLWLIEGSVINHLQGLLIQALSLDKWSMYELDIDKVVLKCNILKGE